MEDMAAQMNAILNDPEAMQKIMSLAKALDPNAANDSQPASAPETSPGGFPELDMATIQKLAGFAGKTNIDSNQKSLLKALMPYLTREHIQKLERAMRAAKLAGIASALLGSNGAPFPIGR